MVKKGKTPQDIRQANLELIFKLLREHTALSCSELAAGTGLSNTAVANIIEGLYDRGVVVKSTLRPVVVAGRHPVRYVFNKAGRCALFFDFTHDAYGLMDFEGGVIYKKDMPPISIWGRTALEKFFRQVSTEIEGLGQELMSVSIALVGKQDRDSGNIVVSRKFASDVNLGAIAGGVFMTPVQIINDTYLLLTAERMSAKSANILYLYFGRGISCAFCLGGKLYTGAHDYAGELGMMLMPDGRTVEQVLTKERLIELESAVEAGDMKGFGQDAGAVASFVLNVAKLMDFDDIVVGSPYSHFASAFVSRLNAVIAKDRFIKPQVTVSAAFSEGFGLISSALMFMHLQLINQIKT